MDRPAPSGLFAVVCLAAALALAGCGGGGSGATGSGSAATPTPPAQPSLTSLANQPPVGVFLAILLTDGTVIAQANPGNGAGQSAADFYKLTPDASGNYAKGVWTRISSPPSGYAPYAGEQAVLADGRVLFVGGEYNQDNYSLPFAPSGLTNMSAVYDPVADGWTMIAPPAGVAYIGDAPSTVMPDGTFVFGEKLGKAMWSLNPQTLTWSSLTSTGKHDNFAEEGFTLLPSGNLLVVDVAAPPATEHYVRTTGAWVSDGSTPSSLASPTSYPNGLTYGPAPVQVVGGVTYGPGPAGTYFPPGEMGPAILRPDGSVFATGSADTGQAGHTAIYKPGATASAAGTWTAGPDFPGADNAGDSNAALLPSGNVLVAGASGALYEFNGSSLTTTFSAPAGATSGAPVFLLPLPSGQVLVLSPTLTVAASVYASVGSPQSAWAPTISQVASTLTRGQTHPLTGTQLNGLSQGAAYGDEFTSATNYPLVRLTNTGSGHVWYARTHGHSSMGVATGAALVSTNFDVPKAAESGATTLVVIANGIASAPFSVTLN